MRAVVHLSTTPSQRQSIGVVLRTHMTSSWSSLSTGANNEALEPDVSGICESKIVLYEWGGKMSGLLQVHSVTWNTGLFLVLW